MCTPAAQSRVVCVLSGQSEDVAFRQPRTRSRDLVSSQYGSRKIAIIEAPGIAEPTRCRGSSARAGEIKARLWSELRVDACANASKSANALFRRAIAARCFKLAELHNGKQ